MTYFFIFLLQTLLPTTLLLASAWSQYPRLNLKSLAGLSFCGVILGILAAVYLPNTQVINLTLNIITLISLILFYASQFIYSIRLNQSWQFILIAIAALKWARDPNISAITNTDVINTDFLLHSSAVILGVIFCISTAVWLVILLRQYKTVKKSTALCHTLTALLILLLCIPLLGEILLSLMKLQIIELTKVRLSFVAKSAALTDWFNYISCIFILLLLLLFTVKIHATHKQAMLSENHSIEKRKKTALYRTSFRTLAYGVAGVILLCSCQLYWDKIASQPPQLSEAVPVKLNEQNQIQIPIEQVKDGKLHRFVWIADDGKAVRFFIINRLPDRLSLAAVFDACILCGDQGYVMENDQVICVGCGVRMFIPSIGKPGGCNPVPIEDWQQTDSQVIIHKKNLEDGLNLFSTIVEIEVTDPISGKKLSNLQTEFKYNHDSKTYFFENEKNLEEFRENPEKYSKF